MSTEGEIAIEWDATAEKLHLLTMIDVTELPHEQVAIHKMIEQYSLLTHPNVMKFTETPVMLANIQTLVFKTDAPDHISTWKQFCKSEMSIFNTLSVFRQLTAAVASMNELGITHRDVHPTRLHLHNGILKFNLIGLPYNFKKLIRNPHFSGHLNYSAPELLFDKNEVTTKADTWSLGCCLYYLVTKKDPFYGATVSLTKENILNLEIDSSDELRKHHKIFAKLIYKCLTVNQSKRLTSTELLQFQDHLEMLEFNVAVSHHHFKLLMR
jgi:serine/threonine protein kinase